MTKALATLVERLQERSSYQWSPYAVPGRWVGSAKPQVFPGAPAYLLHQIERLSRIAVTRPAPWTASRQTIYNAFVRHTVAYDHGPGTEMEGWRTDGSFVKLLALLPYLHTLGIRTLSLLPIMARGAVGGKGGLGSPYAVRHPLRLDPTLAEPALGLGADAEFRALVDMAHALDMRVVVEVVLRTAARDSDLVAHHPEWFYWADEASVLSGAMDAAPALPPADVERARAMVDAAQYRGLPEPPAAWREAFLPPPQRVFRDDGHWVGMQPDGRRSRIPGAFADWPPDDPQPAWSDVTYLRLHDHSQYRYMAYNTVRMFERELERPEHRQQGLWNLVSSIIPHFVRVYGVDGAMIDMGHALPPDLRRQVMVEARRLRPDLQLWEETFTMERSSATAGYDAVMGYLPFDAMVGARLTDFVRRIADGDRPVAYFATPESHNTPRARGRDGNGRKVLAVWTLLQVLPGARTVVVAGMELGETVPVNTGLGFTAAEAAGYPPAMLPLFSRAFLPWDGADGIDDGVAAVHDHLARATWARLRTDADTLAVLYAEDDTIVVHRHVAGQPHGVIAATNLGGDDATVHLPLPDGMVVAVTDGVDSDGASVSFVLRAWSTTLVPTWQHDLPALDP